MFSEFKMDDEYKKFCQHCLTDDGEVEKVTVPHVNYNFSWYLCRRCRGVVINWMTGNMCKIFEREDK